MNQVAIGSAVQTVRTEWLTRILALILVGAATAVAKKAHMSLGIPGHSALLWLTTMIAGRAMVRQEGGGLLIGASAALWGIPVGLENTVVHNIALYGATGIALDLFSKISAASLQTLRGAFFAGMAAHMVKFGFIVAGALSSTTAKHFLLFGLVKAGLLHLFFGAAAGILGFAAFKGISRLITPG